MNDTVQAITPAGLMLGLIPVVIVIVVLFRWSLDAKSALYATGRMLIQLVLIGYVLTFIFDTDEAWLVAGVLTVMLIAASWIALRPLQQARATAFSHALVAIGIGGVSTLILVTQVVVGVEPWYEPRYVIPIAGMIFAGSMNAVSLAAERFAAERERAATIDHAKRTALQAALIPLINSFFAVGLVSLPGMMTGQILSGVSPLTAARYQIVVMAMMFGSAGIAAAVYLVLAARDPKWT